MIDLDSAPDAVFDPDSIHKNVPAEISGLTQKVTPVSGDHLLIEDSANSDNKKRVEIGDLPSGMPSPHDLGGAQHIADTLANLNSKVSDATLIDTGDSRLSDSRAPTAHASDHTDGSDDIQNATAAQKGLATATQITKLDGIETAAKDDQTAGEIEAIVSHDNLLDFLIAQHRIINDSGDSTTELFSSNKINALTAAISAGIDVKDPVETSTEGLGNITLSGEQTLNGVTTSASRIIVTEQTAAEDNGIYVTAAGAWSRSTDADTDAEVTNGMSTMVLNASSTFFRDQYILTTSDPITLGVTALSFSTIPALSFGTTAGTAAEGNDSRIPLQDENDALVGTNGIPSSTNKYVTNTDPRNTNARTPVAHDLAGAEHNADTLANLNGKVSDATLIDTGDSRLSDSRTPTGTAGGDLNGTYPNPSVDDGADSTAVHDNVSGEISALTEKATPVNADLVIIEDSAASNAKKKVQLGNLPGGGGAADEVRLFYADQMDNPNNADWTVNALAPAIADDVNNGLTIRAYNDTIEEGAGFILSIPSGKTNMVFTFKSRRKTTTTGQFVKPKLYYRAIDDNSAVDAWAASGVVFTKLDMTVVSGTKFFQYDTETLTLSGIGLTAGELVQFELTRVGADGDDDLADDWFLLELSVQFT